MKFYRVGGCVRDDLMGVKSKDIDYTVVLEEDDFPAFGTTVEVPEPYAVMIAELEKRGMKVFKDKFTGNPVGAEFYTARALDLNREPVDFVLARKERGYADGRRPDSVEIGTLYDDLSRRDFTMNAIAQDVDDPSVFIDPFNGQVDIAARVIRAVGDPMERMQEDALRAVRAIRFSVTKGMAIEPATRFAIQTAAVCESIRTNVSDERIDEEIRRMFAFDNVAAMRALMDYPTLTDAMLSGSVSITSTMKSIKTKG